MSNLTASKFQPNLYQANVYMALPCLTAADVYSKLPDELRGILDADPFMMPIPPDAPAEIPRGQFRDKANVWNLTVTANILTLRWSSPDLDRESLPATEFFSKANDYLTQLIASLTLKICRIAAVQNYYVYVDNAAKELAQHFCKDYLQKKPFNRPENFEISSHKVFNLTDEIKVNSWVKNRSAKTLKDDKDIVLVEIDFNTLAEEMALKTFKDEEIKSFFNVSNTKSLEVLSLYYPQEI